MYDVIDISTWEYENKGVSGSKEKRWYRHPETNELILFKLPISYTSDNWTIMDEVSGEVWAEKIASEMGQILGITTHRVEIGCLTVNEESIAYYGIDIRKIPDNKIIYGALCYSFLQERAESLIEGADMIMEVDPTYDRNELRGHNEIYNYDLLERLFIQHGIVEHLFRMIVFDSLIGNTDRHQDNFGIIRNEALGTDRFAPLYDNASSLGRELPHRKVTLMMQDNQMFGAYIHGNKSATLIRWEPDWTEKRLNIFVFLDHVISRQPGIRQQLQLIENLNNDVLQDILVRIPAEIMTAAHKLFVEKLLKARRDHLKMRYLDGIR